MVVARPLFFLHFSLFLLPFFTINQQSAREYRPPAAGLFGDMGLVCRFSRFFSCSALPSFGGAHRSAGVFFSLIAAYTHVS